MTNYTDADQEANRSGIFSALFWVVWGFVVTIVGLASEVGLRFVIWLPGMMVTVISGYVFLHYLFRYFRCQTNTRADQK